MDAQAFDRLTRILGATSSRRAAIGALIAASPLAGLLDTSAKKRKARRNGDGRDRDKRRKGRDNDERNHGKGKVKDKNQPRAQAADCWRTGACVLKKGANASRCNLTGYTVPPNLDCTRCNISRANLRGANLSGANLTAANLSGACLIDADLTGTTIATNTNMHGAVICRTRMPDGSLSDAGCGLGTECCPVCDATHPCPVGQLCCAGRCVSGQCCVAGDCADQTCRNKECTSNQCVYALQGSGTGGTSCADPLQCCNGTCCPSGQKCCGGQCIDAGRCCVSNVPDVCPDNGRCCEGECLLPFECCTGGQLNCPPDQTCLEVIGADPACCPNDQVCNEQCCADGQTCCGSTCIPIGACCTNGQVGCPDARICCPGGICAACCAPGSPCTDDAQCTNLPGNADDPINCAPLPERGGLCRADTLTCCLRFDTACTEDEQCCSGTCGGFGLSDTCQ